MSAKVPIDKKISLQISEDIAGVLSQHMEKKRFDEKKMAQEIGVSVHGFKNYLSGTYNFNIREIVKIQMVTKKKIIKTKKYVDNN